MVTWAEAVAELNAAGEIDRLVLQDVTGDTQPYVYVSGIEDNSSEMNISVSYTYIQDGQVQNISGGAKYAIKTGGVMLVYEKDSLKIGYRYDNADSPAGGIAQVVIPAGEGIVLGIYLRQVGQIIALTANAVPEQNLEVFSDFVLLSASHGEIKNQFQTALSRSCAERAALSIFSVTASTAAVCIHYSTIPKGAGCSSAERVAPTGGGESKMGVHKNCVAVNQGRLS